MKTKLKPFEVLVTGFRTIIVHAKDAADVHERICDHNPYMGSDWEVDEFRVERELTPHEFERAKAHGAQPMEDL
jgi:hypothetical protein